MTAGQRMGWREVFRPELEWAPRTLPGWFKGLPGWLGRGAAEARFGSDILHWERDLLCGSGPVSGAAPGNGRPVLVVPGFGFGDASTLPMQHALRSAGYQVVRSQIVMNVRCPDITVASLAEVARAAVERDGGRRLLVVGHSRGGMIARGLAVLHPELVARVISLAAPLNHEFAFYEAPAPLVVALREVHQLHPVHRERGCATPDCTCPYMTASWEPLPADLDLVSIFSKSDGIVDWRACVVPGARNIEISGSHLGMGLRSESLALVLRELARPVGSGTQS